MSHLELAKRLYLELHLELAKNLYLELAKRLYLQGTSVEGGRPAHVYLHLHQQIFESFATSVTHLSGLSPFGNARTPAELHLEIFGSRPHAREDVLELLSPRRKWQGEAV